MVTRNAVVPILHDVGKSINRSLPGQAKRLERWHMAFAEWLVTHPKPHPSKSRQLSKATELAGRDVTAAELRSLRYRSVAYRQYWDQLSNNEVLEAAKTKLKELAFRGVDAHDQGLQMALAAADHRAIYNYTTPLLERVMPKKADGINATQVNITLSLKQAAALEDAEVIEVLSEPIGEPE